MDYMVGSGSTIGGSEIDSCLICVAAKKEWPESGVAQILAEMGCLQKHRFLKGKRTAVFGMLSNGSMFQFFAVGANNKVYCSRQPIVLCPEQGSGNYQSSESLASILGWLNWFLDTVQSTSPRSRPRWLLKLLQVKIIKAISKKRWIS